VQVELAISCQNAVQTLESRLQTASAFVQNALRGTVATLRNVCAALENDNLAGLLTDTVVQQIRGLFDLVQFMAA
jgi:hypothetical protein